MGRAFDVFQGPPEKIRTMPAVEKELAWQASFPQLNPDPIVEADLEGRVHYLNPAAERLFPDLGLLQGRHPWLKDWQQVAAAVRQAADGRINREVLVDQRWYQQSIYIVESVQRLRTYGFDITERKQAEVAAEQERTLLRTLIDHLPDCIYIKDTEGRFVTANSATAHLMGASSPEALRGQTDAAFYPSSSAAEFRTDEERVLRLGQPLINKEEPHVDPAGLRREMLTTKVPLKDPQGQIVGLVGITRDITERKRAEEALREADRRKDEFLATLAHELRNPLAPIRNALGLLHYTGDDVKTFLHVRPMMERQVKHLVRLVDDLLDVSRITRGKFELRKQRLDIAEAVNSALEASRPMIEAARHELTVTVPEEPLYVKGDLTRLAQVVSNLLNNAAKYTPEGGRIALTVTRDDRQVVLRIRDNGLGIPREMMPRLFEMFTQAHRHLEQSQCGLGLGLALVKNIVRMHGGTVEVGSDGPNQGSEFVVRLPLLKEEPSGPSAAGEQGRNNEQRTALRHRILVVDDNKDSANSLGLLVQLMGNEVRTAYDGPNALALAEAFRPEMVLLDLGMPGMDGYEVACRMRQRLDFRDVVLVAQTGWGQEEDRQRTRDAGFDHHLVKPVDQAVLKTLFDRLPSPLADAVTT